MWEHQAVKYLFKYIYKGHDRASVAMKEANKEDSEGNINERLTRRIVKGTLMRSSSTEILDG
jgi:hypothetical protein